MFSLVIWYVDGVAVRWVPVLTMSCPPPVCQLAVKEAAALREANLRQERVKARERRHKEAEEAKAKDETSWIESQRAARAEERLVSAL